MTPHASREGSQQPRTGNVKWFNEIKGVGVIRGVDDGEYPVHFSEIMGDGFRTLAEGEAVEFEVGGVPDGPQAARVRRLSED